METNELVKQKSFTYSFYTTKSTEEVFRQLREIAKQRKLHPLIRVAQAKCLGQCAKGVNIMVYPENTWHSDVRTEDVAQIADNYIQ